MPLPGSNDGTDLPMDDTIQIEIGYLELLLERRPAVAPIVLGRLGDLGAEGCADLPRLMAERRVRVQQLAARRRQAIVSRAAAVAAIIATTPTLVMGAPAAADELPPAQQAPAKASQQALVPQFELRVMDRASGVPLAGVRLQTAADELVAVTDENGRAIIPAKYAQEPVLTLEHEGYPLVLIEGAKLSERSLITMKHFSGGNPPATSPWPNSLAALSSPGGPVPPMEAAVPKAEDALPKQLELTPKPPVMPVAPAAHPAPVHDAPVVAHDAPAAPHPAPVAVAHVAPAPVAHGPARAPETAAKAPKLATKDLPPAAAEKPAVTAPAHPAEPQVAALPIAPHELPVPKPATDPAAKPAPSDDLPPPMASRLPSPVPIANVDLVPKAVVRMRLPARAAKAGPQPRRTDAVPFTLPQAPEAPMPVTPKLPEHVSAPFEPTTTHPEPTAVHVPMHVPLPAGLKPIKPPTAIAAIVLPRAPRPPRMPAAREIAGQQAAVPHLVLAPPSAIKKATQYTVRAGDMLSTIAARELGSASLWTLIFDANRDKLTNPRWLQVGIVLEIPKGGLGRLSGGSYVVRPGDSLSLIAKEQLGDMRKWRELFNANRHIIRNPWIIFPGQKLVLPGVGAHSASLDHPPMAWATLKATETPPG